MSQHTFSKDKTNQLSLRLTSLRKSINMSNNEEHFLSKRVKRMSYESTNDEIYKTCRHRYNTNLVS
jgi:hypothetical protein